MAHIQWLCNRPQLNGNTSHSQLNFTAVSLHCSEYKPLPNLGFITAQVYCITAQMGSDTHIVIGNDLRELTVRFLSAMAALV